MITPVFADGFDSIKPADPLLQMPLPVNTIALPIKKATLTHNSLHNQYVFAFDRFVQSNVKSAYMDFKVLIAFREESSCFPGGNRLLVWEYYVVFKEELCCFRVNAESPGCIIFA